MDNRSCTIRAIKEGDAEIISAAFAAQNWERHASQYTAYLAEQNQGKRQVFIAEWEGEFAGYVTLLPCCHAGPFQGTGFPEISDFNVLIKFQCKGIGSALLDAAETAAAQQCDTVTLGVGLHAGYGSAQRLYVKRGYIPDGSGVWYREHPLPPNATCINDDDLVLYLSKKLLG